MARDFGRLIAHRRNLVGELFGKPEIIRIEECDEFARGGGDSGIARCGGAAIARMHDAAQRGLIKLGKRRRKLIGRGVVNDDDLGISVALRQDRQNGAPNKVGAVVNGDDDADQRLEGRAGVRRNHSGSPPLSLAS